MTDAQVVEALGIARDVNRVLQGVPWDSIGEALDVAIKRFGVCECENRWHWHLESYDDREYPFCPACGKRLEVNP